ARISRACAHRADALGDTARRLLLLLAASDSGEVSVLERAAASLGLDLADLGAAEEAGLIRLEGARVQFSHPLARTGVYSEAPADARRDAHRALADALPDRDADRRAWHLALAIVGT